MGIGFTGYPALVTLLALDFQGYCVNFLNWFAVTGPGWPYGRVVYPDHA